MKIIFITALLFFEGTFAQLIPNNILNQIGDWVRPVQQIAPNLTSFLLSEDGRLNFTGIANKYGFYCEEHDVVTEDGYILKAFRIPGDTNRPILLTHGSSDTSDGWIIRGKTSLAITLARMGYDVWAINTRGTRYSRRHVSIDPDLEPSKFFNFTFYEAGIYDSPAIIDYILYKTGQPQLTLIGHSQGTAVYFIMAAERPEYNEKVKLFIALAPIVYMNNARGVLPLISQVLSAGKDAIVTDIGGVETINYNRISPILRLVCLPTNIQKAVCREVIFSVFGSDEETLELSFLNTMAGHYTGGSTLKIAFYFGQLVNEDEFRRYDYGPVKNLEYYNSVKPPIIDLRKVTMKTALFVGKEDFLSTPPDIERLSNILPNVVEHLVMPRENFNHLDFIIANNMNEILYPYLFDVLFQYG